MNIEKLEKILHEMQRAEFGDLLAANERVRQWAEEIGGAITEHLLAELGGGSLAAPAMSSEPGGHNWDDEY